MTPKGENQINSEQVSMQIIMRLRQIIQEMSKHSKLLLENYKISAPQLICLNEVFQHGPISIGALTKIVFLNNSTVTGIVDRLALMQDADVYLDKLKGRLAEKKIKTET